jgi:WD40 repeat protein/DNA-directed RNA polymerase subunit RPC12/RpoP
MPKKSNAHPGLKLRHTLSGHENHVYRMALSSDGQILASPSEDKTVRIWDINSGKLLRTLKGSNTAPVCVAWSPDGKIMASDSNDTDISLWNGETGDSIRILKGHSDQINSIAWSPDGNILASGSGKYIDTKDNTIRLWNAETAKTLKILKGHSAGVEGVAWSPDGRTLCSGSWDHSIRLWDAKTGKGIREFKGHTRPVCSVVWSPDGQHIASGSYDLTVRIWNPETGQQTNILEAHTDDVVSVSFFDNGRLLGSLSEYGTVVIWRTDTWTEVAHVDKKGEPSLLANLVFHPTLPVMAVRGENQTEINIWELDFNVLLGEPAAKKSIHYTNAKVVLVGETSTGKTCIARALMGKPFEPQESTHGMKVWNFKSEKAKRPDGGEITRETLLWDLAGQPDYQVVHQLFLDETALGVVLFDPTHPENPFGGVAHWEKALRKVVGDDCPRLLVAGRVDRGHPTATERDIKAFLSEHGFIDFIATSAKTDVGIKELHAAITRAIPWDNLPITSSPELWKEMRDYLLERRKGKEVLTRRSDLLGAFRQKHPEAVFSEADFDTVISHAQAQGLVWRLSFGDFVLVKPEILNDYASAVVRVARKHPEGLGAVSEQDVLEARIDFEDLKRLPDPGTERSLLHAVVELFLNRELALREGGQLVFPSKFNRKLPEYPKPPIREVAYRFSGPIEDIYATSVVRIFYSGAYEMKNLWKNAAEFRDTMERECGFILKSPNEGYGIISVFFEDKTSMDSKVLFLKFIHEHLYKHSLSDSVKRERIYRCPECGEEVENRRAVEKRLTDGRRTIPCQYCETQIPLFDLLEEKFGDQELLQQVRELEKEADEKKEQAVGLTTYKAKEDIGEFDVFMAHNSEDKQQVIALSEILKGRGLNPWLDVEQIPPGRWFQDVIQQVIPKVKSAAIITGKKGMGKWEILELRSFISQCVEKDIPVIPVLLPGISKLPSKLLFLKELNWVRFMDNIDETEALDNLVWGITGERPQRKPK